jgi:hypothetical protein
VILKGVKDIYMMVGKRLSTNHLSVNLSGAYNELQAYLEALKWGESCLQSFTKLILKREESLNIERLGMWWLDILWRSGAPLVLAFIRRLKGYGWLILDGQIKRREMLLGLERMLLLMSYRRKYAGLF